jgi:hypothetical protein
MTMDLSVAYWRSAVLAAVLPIATSRLSTRTVSTPSPTRRCATSAPVMPPPMMATSQVCRRSSGG